MSSQLGEVFGPKFVRCVSLVAEAHSDAWTKLEVGGKPSTQLSFKSLNADSRAHVGQNNHARKQNRHASSL